MNQQELQEAIDAGERLRSKVEQALSELKSARGWGLWDMFGGGMFSTFAKRSKMKEAERTIQDINHYAKRFESELRDIHMSLDLDLTRDSFLGFADYFFDNFFVDFMVQSKINEGLRQLENYQDRLDQLMRTLYQHRTR